MEKRGNKRCCECAFKGKPVWIHACLTTLKKQFTWFWVVSASMVQSDTRASVQQVFLKMFSLVFAASLYPWTCLCWLQSRHVYRHTLIPKDFGRINETSGLTWRRSIQVIRYGSHTKRADRETTGLLKTG